eukprot:TRINITY_DN56722_c0_g1_i1.p1 TRINITY_DN56722_c0_g1~~TRINITY_DN56722_c0_g1_i1.p1  ORF type:complete len:605 (-),score=130.54 TRINITY_DN56722_c0_g1_i1:482-2296(-)
MSIVGGGGDVLTMIGEQKPAVMESAYKKFMEKRTEQLDGEMCWPVEWFPEHLPTESASGNSMYFNLQARASPLSCVDGGQWPPVDNSEVKREDVLVFSDSYGYCKEIMQQAPPGRIGLSSVQTKAPEKYSEKDVQKLVGSQSWDLIIYAFGIDPPASNSVEDIHKQQDAVVKVLLYILKVLADDATRCKRLCIISVDTFAEEREICEEMGLGLITNATLFGMANTARTEVQCPIQFIDTEWALRTENTKYLVAEIFRHHSFGQNSVRLLNKGRYVLRQMPSKPYENKPDMQLPVDGVIGISGGNGALGLVMGLWLLRKAQEQGGKKFTIKFLSRSMKISDQNMPNWKEIQNLAASIGIEVEQAKCDVSSQESVDDFIKRESPNLTGFIHSAGILQDAMLMNQTWEKFDAVYEAKSRAAVYIHDALERFENPKLEFFWMFSSGAVYGNMGQLNYSSSNSFLDALCRYRRALGKPAMAPQWGAWGEVGMAANLDDASKRRMNMGPMPPFTNAQGLYGLECGLRTGLPYFSVHKLNCHSMFGIVQGSDHPSQANFQNFACMVTPSAPGDPKKNPYHTLTYELRKSMDIADGLVFQTHHPKLAKQMAR